MRDLTDTDVRLLEEFLVGACDDVARWLPPPQWDPLWQSEAARECANIEPGIGVRMRVARFWLIRASGAEWLAEAVALTDPGAAPGAYGETPAMVEAAVAGLGLMYSRQQNRRTRRWSWTCEGTKLPGYTARATAFEAACGMTAVYSIYSAPAHAEWHAIISRYRQEVLPDGRRPMVTRPDRMAVAAAAIAAVGFAVRPADRALSLLGRKARLAEIPYHALHARELMRRFELSG